MYINYPTLNKVSNQSASSLVGDDINHRISFNPKFSGVR